jgi:hypothetical protein
MARVENRGWKWRGGESIGGGVGRRAGETCEERRAYRRSTGADDEADAARMGSR